MYKFDFKSGHFKLLTLFNLLIGFLLLVSVLMFAKDLLSSLYVKSVKSPLPATAERGRVEKATLQEYEIILRNNPFGFTAGPLKNLASMSGKHVSQTEIILIGTIAGAERYSYAIFSDMNNKQEVFRVGEDVFGLGKLRRVTRDRVFISGKNGAVEIPIADIVKVIDVNSPQGSTVSSAFAKSVGEGAYLVDQKKIQQAIENPNQLMTDARLLPNFVDGKQEGFIVREVKNGGIYQSMGLQNSDILLRINDYNISNPESALQAFTALRGMDRVRLDIMRNGAKTTLTYQIR